MNAVTKFLKYIRCNYPNVLFFIVMINTLVLNSLKVPVALELIFEKQKALTYSATLFFVLLLLMVKLSPKREAPNSVTGEPSNKNIKRVELLALTALGLFSLYEMVMCYRLLAG